MIKYKSGFRHQLYEEAWTQTKIYPEYDIETDYIILLTTGQLGAKKGYAWDGPSGPCRLIADRLPGFLKRIYLKTILEGSLFHDALYQLMRMGLLKLLWREQSDKEFKRINLKNGMSNARACWTYKAVRKAAAGSADPKNKRPILTAP